MFHCLGLSEQTLTNEQETSEVNLLMAATQDAFVQYYGSQSVMSSLAYSKSTPSLRSLQDQPQ